VITTRQVALVLAGGFVLLLVLWKAATLLNWNTHYRVGQEIDQLNGVAVFYNGGVSHSSGRNLAPDGYNLGLKYQCVEFVKRYYYEHLSHKMPDAYGHAKQFFNAALSDGARNPQRDLVQYANGGQSKPRPDDLLVFGPSLLNRYGHVAIVSAVSDTAVEIVQQNPGPFGRSRERIALRSDDGQGRCQNGRVLGWLRKEPKTTQRTGVGNSVGQTNRAAGAAGPGPAP
jgi:hypothetical protein